MGLFKKKKKNRVCVIGLDGMPYSLLQDLTKKGIMPAVESLSNSGTLHRMKASLPEVSSVSWTNFMTGSNPGTHGIFGFTDFKKNSYELRFPNFHDVKKETFWDVLGHMKKKSIVINQPSTYPARRIHGILISGFVAIELAKAVYPLSFKPELEKMSYQIDIDTFKAREDHEFLWKDLDKTLESRIRVLQSLWDGDWDYFEFVITGTDRLHHFLWSAYTDESHPYHPYFLNYYRKIDSVIEKIVHSFRKIHGSEEGLYLLSDHGFTGIQQEVYLNAWLEKEGYLKFSSASPQNLDEIAPGSAAFAMDPNRIYLNLKGKFPKGCVGESEKENLKREIAEKLAKLDYNGVKVIREVFDTQKIYNGPLVPSGPDLIALSIYGFDMKGSVKKKEVFGRSSLEGMHTWDDAFFWAPAACSPDLSISDVAAVIMEHFS